MWLTPHVNPVSSRLLSSQTLLIRGCGRTDFQEGSSEAMYRSIHQRLFTLPDDTMVWMYGHTTPHCCCCSSSPFFFPSSSCCYPTTRSTAMMMTTSSSPNSLPILPANYDSSPSSSSSL